MNSQPWGITAAPDGALWFTEYVGNKIGRITTDGFVQEFELSRTRGFPIGITADRSGNIWFVESTQTPSRIGRLSVLATVAVPAASIWTLTALAFLLAAVGLIVFNRR